MRPRETDLDEIPEILIVVRPNQHRRTGRGGLQPPSRAKVGQNSGKLSGNFVPLDIDLHEVTKSAYRFATLRFCPIQQRCAANVKLRCSVYIGLRSVQELMSLHTPCNLQLYGCWRRPPPTNAQVLKRYQVVLPLGSRQSCYWTAGEDRNKYKRWSWD